MHALRLCEKCVHFVPGRYSHTGSCKRYVAYRGRGKMVYEFTDTVRLDKKRCGPDGRFYISKELMEDEE